MDFADDTFYVSQAQKWTPPLQAMPEFDDLL